MTQQLLAYVSSDFTDNDVLALRTAVEALAQSRKWSVAAPAFVDETDGASCSAPDDEPVRTVCVVLPVASRGEVPGTPVGEPEDLLKILAVFSLERRIDLEVQLDATYVGEIRSGRMDELLRQGLLDRW